MNFHQLYVVPLISARNNHRSAQPTLLLVANLLVCLIVSWVSRHCSYLYYE